MFKHHIYLHIHSFKLKNQNLNMKKFFIFALVITVFAACNSGGSDAEEAQVGEAQDAAELHGSETLELVPKEKDGQGNEAHL